MIESYFRFLETFGKPIFWFTLIELPIVFFALIALEAPILGRWTYKHTKALDVTIALAASLMFFLSFVSTGYEAYERNMEDFIMSAIAAIQYPVVHLLCIVYVWRHWGSLTNVLNQRAA